MPHPQHVPRPTHLSSLPTFFFTHIEDKEHKMFQAHIQRRGLGHFGRGHLGRGHYGRGHLGRGHYGRGHLGRGHYGRGHFGRGHLGRGHFGSLI